MNTEVKIEISSFSKPKNVIVCFFEQFVLICYIVSSRSCVSVIYCWG